MFSASRSLAPGVIVALLLVSSLPSVVTAQQDEEVAALPVMLPAEIPDGVDAGTLDTPLGPARWVHLKGDRSLPEWSEDGYGAVGVGSGGAVRQGDLDTVISSPSGFASLSNTDPEIWWSADLVSWTSSPMPTDAGGAQLAWTDGAFWLSTSDPAGLWRSTDAKDWVEVDLSELTPPVVPGLDWQQRIGTPVSSNGTTIVPVIFEAPDTLSFLGLPITNEHTSLWLVGADGDSYVTHDHRGQSYRLRFDKTPDGLRVISADDGTIHGELEGVGMDLIEGWAAHDDRGDRRLESVVLAIVDDKVATPVDSSMSTYAPTFLHGADSGFTAYQNTTDDLIRVWHSQYGDSWAEVESVGDDPDEPSAETFIGLRAHPDRIDARNTDTDELWTSTDGLTWGVDEHPIWDQDDYDRPGENQPWPTRFGRFEGDHVRVAYTRLPAGFVRLLADHVVDYDEASPFVSVHSLLVLGEDGTTSSVVDLTGLEIEVEDHGGLDLVPISGNTAVYLPYPLGSSPGREREAWIFTFDEVPA